MEELGCSSSPDGVWASSEWPEHLKIYCRGGLWSLDQNTPSSQLSHSPSPVRSLPVLPSPTLFFLEILSSSTLLKTSFPQLLQSSLHLFPACAEWQGGVGEGRALNLGVRGLGSQLGL